MVILGNIGLHCGGLNAYIVYLRLIMNMSEPEVTQCTAISAFDAMLSEAIVVVFCFLFILCKKKTFYLGHAHLQVQIQICCKR